MQLVFEQIRAGGDRNLGYLLADRDAGQGVLIDPSFSPEAFVQRARDQDISIVHVVNTHSHPDHINGNERAKTMTGAPLVAHVDAPTQPHVTVTDRQEIAVGSLVLRFFHVPGHCPDHVVVYEPRHRILITGDLLFVGKVGGTRSDEDARVEWSSLRRLLELPDETTVWPGHDYGARPSSTIALEKASNPFLRCPDVDGFLALKRDWPNVKQRWPEVVASCSRQDARIGDKATVVRESLRNPRALDAPAPDDGDRVDFGRKHQRVRRIGEFDATYRIEESARSMTMCGAAPRRRCSRGTSNSNRPTRRSSSRSTSYEAASTQNRPLDRPGSDTLTHSVVHEISAALRPRP